MEAVSNDSKKLAESLDVTERFLNRLRGSLNAGQLKLGLLALDNAFAVPVKIMDVTRSLSERLADSEHLEPIKKLLARAAQIGKSLSSETLRRIDAIDAERRNCLAGNSGPQDGPRLAVPDASFRPSSIIVEALLSATSASFGGRPNQSLAAAGAPIGVCELFKDVGNSERNQPASYFPVHKILRPELAKAAQPLGAPGAELRFEHGLMFVHTKRAALPPKQVGVFLTLSVNLDVDKAKK